jgi:putative transcriptional regulator
MTDPRVSNKIRRFRFEHNEMTQEQLAALTGVTRQTIISLEGNKYIPSLGLAFRLARVFGVTVEDVFQLVDPGEATAGVSPHTTGETALGMTDVQRAREVKQLPREGT